MALRTDEMHILSLLEEAQACIESLRARYETDNRATDALSLALIRDQVEGTHMWLAKAMCLDVKDYERLGYNTATYWRGR